MVPLFERSACVYVAIIGNFERFQDFSFETHFPGKREPFSKDWSTAL